MRNNLNWKQGRMAAVAVLAVFATVASGRMVFAQLTPNNTPIQEFFDADTKDLRLDGSLAEARSGGHILDAWRANDNTGAVWFSYDGSNAFQVGTTKTFASPAVAPFGNFGEFIVFHTGTDGRIYYAFVAGSGPKQNSGSWQPIPDVTTPNNDLTTPNNMNVSAAPIGQGVEQVLVAFRASGDQRVLATWYNGTKWSTANPIVGKNGGVGEAVAGPAICLDNNTQPHPTMWAVAIGTDNQVWITHQNLGDATWGNWTPEGQFVGPTDATNMIQSPSCAAADNGNVVVSAVTSPETPLYLLLNSDGGVLDGWVEGNDIEFGQTADSVSLVSNGSDVFQLLTSGNDSEGANNAGWEQVYSVF